LTNYGVSHTELILPSLQPSPHVS